MSLELRWRNSKPQACHHGAGHGERGPSQAAAGSGEMPSMRISLVNAAVGWGQTDQWTPFSLKMISLVVQHQYLLRQLHLQPSPSSLLFPLHYISSLNSLIAICPENITKTEMGGRLAEMGKCMENLRSVRIVKFYEVSRVARWLHGH